MQQITINNKVEIKMNKAEYYLECVRAEKDIFVIKNFLRLFTTKIEERFKDKTTVYSFRDQSAIVFNTDTSKFTEL